MRLKSYMTISTWIFLIVGFMDLYRAFKKLPMQYGSWHISPFWSWVGGIVLLYLAYQGYRHNRR